MKEIWKDVVDYEGLYKVSNFGRIKRTFVLKPYIDRKGYYFVNLSKNGLVKCCRVHQLVAKSFIPNPLNKTEVNHIDGIKLNNIVSNLEWTTHKENMQHAFRNHLISDEGIKIGILAMTNATKKKVAQLLNGKIIKIYESVSLATKETKINHICCVANGKRKTAGGFEWKYI